MDRGCALRDDVTCDVPSSSPPSACHRASQTNVYNEDVHVPTPPHTAHNIQICFDLIWFDLIWLYVFPRLSRHVFYVLYVYKATTILRVMLRSRTDPLTARSPTPTPLQPLPLTPASPHPPLTWSGCPSSVGSSCTCRWRRSFSRSPSSCTPSPPRYETSSLSSVCAPNDPAQLTRVTRWPLRATTGHYGPLRAVMGHYGPLWVATDRYGPIWTTAKSSWLDFF